MLQTSRNLRLVSVHIIIIIIIITTTTILIIIIITIIITTISFFNHIFFGVGFLYPDIVKVII